MSQNASAVCFPTDIRCGIVLSKQPKFPAARWEESIRSTTAALRKALPEADITGMIPIPDDREPALHAQYRELGRPIDGTLSMVLPGDADPRRFLAAAPVLRGLLRPAIDPAGCVAICGQAMYPKKGYGPYAYTILCFLDPRITQRQFVDWWSSHHSGMGLDSASGGLMAGYGIQLRYDALTTELNEALQFSDKGDLFELVYIDDLEAYGRAVTPEVVKAFCENEKGYIAPDGARVAMQRVLSE